MGSNPNSIYFDDSNGVALGAYYTILKIAEIHSFHVPDAELCHLSESLEDMSKWNLNNLIASTDRKLVRLSNFVRQDTVQILTDLLHRGGWGANISMTDVLGFQSFKFVEFKTIKNTTIVIVLNMQQLEGKYGIKEWTPLGAFDLLKKEFFNWGIFTQLDLRIQAGIQEKH